MQTPKEREKEDINKNHQLFRWRKWKRISDFDENDSNLEDLAAVHGDQSETPKDPGAAKRNERLERSETDAAEILILGWGGDVEILPGTEMKVATVNKAHRTRNGEKEVEGPPIATNFRIYCDM